MSGTELSTVPEGCTAQSIIAGEGDYVLALKGNQGNLHDDVQDLFGYAQEINFQISDVKLSGCPLAKC
jgi:predicted transposase YbfD/YdcC